MRSLTSRRSSPLLRHIITVYTEIFQLLQGRDQQADYNFVRSAMRGLKPGFHSGHGIGQLRRRLLDMREWKEKLAAKPMKVCKRFKHIHIFLILGIAVARQHQGHGQIDFRCRFLLGERAPTRRWLGQ